MGLVEVPGASSVFRMINGPFLDLEKHQIFLLVFIADFSSSRSREEDRDRDREVLDEAEGNFALCIRVKRNANA